MKFFILIFFPLISFSQDYKLEENPNWEKYSKITEMNYLNNSKTEYYLDKGELNFVKIFAKDSLIASNQIKTKIETIRDTIRNQYNSDGLLEFDGTDNYFYNDKKQLTEIRNFEFPLHETKYEYNINGQIEKQISNGHHPSTGRSYRILTLYKYDKCKNIIEEKNIQIEIKNSSQLIKTDISKDDNILQKDITTYTYKYQNTDCIWTKKYSITNNKKSLIKERKLNHKTF